MQQELLANSKKSLLWGIHLTKQALLHAIVPIHHLRFRRNPAVRGLRQHSLNRKGAAPRVPQTQLFAFGSTQLEMMQRVAQMLILTA